MYNKNSTPAGYGGYLQGQGSNGQSMSGMGQVGPGFDQSSGLPGMTSGLPAVQGGSFGTSMPGTSMAPEMMASQQYQSEYRQLAAQRDQLQSMLNIGFPQQMSQGTGEYMKQAQINQNYSSQSGQEYSALDLPGRGRSPPRSLLDLRTYSPPPARGDMYARGGDRRDDRYEDDAHGGDRRDDVYQDDARGGDRRDDRYEDDVRGGDRRDDRYEDDVRGGDRRDDRYEDDDIYDPSFPSGTSPETDYRREYAGVDRGEYDDVSNRSKRKLIVEYGTDSSKRTRVVDSYYEDFDQQPDRQMDSLRSITDSGQSPGGKTRVYFGNITRSTTSRDIKKLLEGTSGVLEVVIAHHVNPNTYKTGAFIEMATPNEAVTIIEEFKGVFYNDGPLLVRLARAHDYENMKLDFNDEAASKASAKSDVQPRPQRDQPQPGKTQTTTTASFQLYVGNVPTAVKPDELLEFLKAYPHKGCRIKTMATRPNKTSVQFAFVAFESEGAAQNSLNHIRPRILCKSQLTYMLVDTKDKTLRAKYLLSKYNEVKDSEPQFAKPDGETLTPIQKLEAEAKKFQQKPPNVPTIKLKGRSKFYKLIADYKTHPLLGLKYISEYVSRYRLRSRFVCYLCETYMDDNPLVNHLTGRLHRMKYLEKVRPDWHRKISEITVKLDQSDELFKAASEIEARDGRQRIKVVYDDELPTASDNTTPKAGSLVVSGDRGRIIGNKGQQQRQPPVGGRTKGVSVFPRLVANYKSHPMLGLKFVTEIIQKQGGSNFACDLCEGGRIEQSGIINHLINKLHRMNYLKRVQPNRHRTISRIMGNLDQMKVLFKAATEIEEIEGRQNVTVVYQGDMNTTMKYAPMNNQPSTIPAGQRLPLAGQKRKMVQDDQQQKDEVRASRARPKFQRLAAHEAEQLLREKRGYDDQIVEAAASREQGQRSNRDTETARMDRETEGRRNRGAEDASRKADGGRIDRRDGNRSDRDSDRRGGDQKTEDKKPVAGRNEAVTKRTNDNKTTDSGQKAVGGGTLGVTGKVGTAEKSATGETTTAKSDVGEINVVKSAAGETTCKLMAKIKFSEAPMLGLSFVTELQMDGLADSPKYLCSLCDCNCGTNFIIPHITGLQHRTKFMERFYNEEHALVAHIADRTERRCKTEVQAKLIEVDMGREDVTVKLVTSSDAEAALFHVEGIPVMTTAAEKTDGSKRLLEQVPSSAITESIPKKPKVTVASPEQNKNVDAEKIIKEKTQTQGKLKLKPGTRLDMDDFAILRRFEEKIFCEPPVLKYSDSFRSTATYLCGQCGYRDMSYQFIKNHQREAGHTYADVFHNKDLFELASLSPVYDMFSCSSCGFNGKSLDELQLHIDVNPHHMRNAPVLVCGIYFSPNYVDALVDLYKEKIEKDEIQAMVAPSVERGMRRSDHRAGTPDRNKRSDDRRARSLDNNKKSDDRKAISDRNTRSDDRKASNDRNTRNDDRKASSDRNTRSDDRKASSDHNKRSDDQKANGVRSTRSDDHKARSNDHNTGSDDRRAKGSDHSTHSAGHTAKSSDSMSRSGDNKSQGTEHSVQSNQHSTRSGDNKNKPQRNDSNTQKSSEPKGKTAKAVNSDIKQTEAVKSGRTTTTVVPSGRKAETPKSGGNTVNVVPSGRKAETPKSGVNAGTKDRKIEPPKSSSNAKKVELKSKTPDKIGNVAAAKGKKTETPKSAGGKTNVVEDTTTEIEEDSNVAFGKVPEARKSDPIKITLLQDVKSSKSEPVKVMKREPIETGVDEYVIDLTTDEDNTSTIDLTTDGAPGQQAEYRNMNGEEIKSFICTFCGFHSVHKATVENHKDSEGHHSATIVTSDNILTEMAKVRLEARKRYSCSACTFSSDFENLVKLHIDRPPLYYHSETATLVDNEEASDLKMIIDTNTGIKSPESMQTNIDGKALVKGAAVKVDGRKGQEKDLTTLSLINKGETIIESAENRSFWQCTSCGHVCPADPVKLQWKHFALRHSQEAPFTCSACWLRSTEEADVVSHQKSVGETDGNIIRQNQIYPVTFGPQPDFVEVSIDAIQKLRCAACSCGYKTLVGFAMGEHRRAVDYDEEKHGYLPSTFDSLHELLCDLNSEKQVPANEVTVVKQYRPLVWCCEKCKLVKPVDMNSRVDPAPLQLWPIKHFLLTHSQDAPYFCGLCDFKAVSRAEVQRHIVKRKHGSKYEVLQGDSIQYPRFTTEKQDLMLKFDSEREQGRSRPRVLEIGPDGGDSDSEERGLVVPKSRKSSTRYKETYESVWKMTRLMRLDTDHLDDHLWQCKACGMCMPSTRLAEIHYQHYHSEWPQYRCGVCRFPGWNLRYIEDHFIDSGHSSEGLLSNNKITYPFFYGEQRDFEPIEIETVDKVRWKQHTPCTPGQRYKKHHCTMAWECLICKDLDRWPDRMSPKELTEHLLYPLRHFGEHEDLSRCEDCPARSTDHNLMDEHAEKYDHQLASRVPMFDGPNIDMVFRACDSNDDVMSKDKVKVTKETNMSTTEVISADEVVKSADVNVKSADVKVKSADVKVKFADVNVKSADVKVKPADIKVKPADVKVKSADVKIKSADVKVKPAGKVVKSTDKEIKSADVELVTADIQITSADIEAIFTDIEFKSTDAGVKSREVAEKSTGEDVKFTNVDGKSRDSKMKSADITVIDVEVKYKEEKNKPAVQTKSADKHTFTPGKAPNFIRGLGAPKEYVWECTLCGLVSRLPTAMSHYQYFHSETPPHSCSHCGHRGKVKNVKSHITNMHPSARLVSRYDTGTKPIMFGPQADLIPLSPKGVVLGTIKAKNCRPGSMIKKYKPLAWDCNKCGLTIPVDQDIAPLYHDQRVKVLEVAASRHFLMKHPPRPPYSCVCMKRLCDTNEAIDHLKVCGLQLFRAGKLPLLDLCSDTPDMRLVTVKDKALVPVKQTKEAKKKTTKPHVTTVTGIASFIKELPLPFLSDVCPEALPHLTWICTVCGICLHKNKTVEHFRGYHLPSMSEKRTLNPIHSPPSRRNKGSSHKANPAWQEPLFPFFFGPQADFVPDRRLSSKLGVQERKCQSKEIIKHYTEMKWHCRRCGDRRKAWYDSEFPTATSLLALGRWPQNHYAMKHAKVAPFSCGKCRMRFCRRSDAEDHCQRAGHLLSKTIKGSSSSLDHPVFDGRHPDLVLQLRPSKTGKRQESSKTTASRENSTNTHETLIVIDVDNTDTDVSKDTAVADNKDKVIVIDSGESSVCITAGEESSDGDKDTIAEVKNEKTIEVSSSDTAACVGTGEESDEEFNLDDFMVVDEISDVADGEMDEGDCTIVIDEVSDDFDEGNDGAVTLDDLDVNISGDGDVADKVEDSTDGDKDSIAVVVTVEVDDMNDGAVNGGGNAPNKLDDCTIGEDDIGDDSIGDYSIGDDSIEVSDIDAFDEC